MCGGGYVTIWRRAAKRDTAEAAIVEALEAAGAWAWRTSLPLDLIVAYHQKIMLLEVKSNRRKPDKRQKTQTELLARFQRDGFPVYVVRSVEDALQAIGAVR